ncbi:MAG: PTS sugar transporter subunit IIB [Novibacillus thermophilus]|jgi:PTS system galactitol-specific IIB component|uniref:PTS galactitol transporter subunit IIB n=1 Tax=Novibacillus thermophilus TaxID=1471761 RepID=A0A1U9K937_9BACL|nr:PTS sugar transporter subunit IIB [Novibacillus thermophilus]AQS56503.1 PTS galactitol transporter subunit IIB [Novibacillus thermophilus]
MGKKKVLIACGAGIATSTVVSNAVEEMIKEHNINADVHQIKIAEIGAHVDTADVLITTTIVQNDYPFPVINARSFLTGIGLEETKQEILKALKD